MRHADLCALITGSTTDQWTVLRNGPLFLDSFDHVSGQGGTWLEVEGPTSLAVWRDDVDLRLAWGMTMDTKLNFGDRWVWPDLQIDRVLVDALWRGALVARWTVLLVDGSRCYLPEPDRAYVRTGEGLMDQQEFASTMLDSEIRLARLLHSLGGGSVDEFEQYLAQSQAVEVPGN
jgi:hypothetical protein